MKKIGVVAAILVVVVINVVAVYFLVFREKEPEDPFAWDPDATSVEVSKEMYRRAWPLTVPSGILECLPGQIIVFHHDGMTYGVNVEADKTEKYADIRPIWKEGTNVPGIKMFMILAEDGLRLCK